MLQIITSFVKWVLGPGKKFEYKETFERKDIHQFFDEIDKRFKAYLQVSIIKPDVLVDSSDTSFNKIDIYRHFDNIDIQDRIIFHNSIKTYRQNYINSYYIVVQDKGAQPMVISVWYLGAEIRVGCFFHPDVVEQAGIAESQMREAVESISKVFEGLAYETRKNRIERNNFILIEQIVAVGGSALGNQNFMDFISPLIANFASNTIKYYFEKSRSAS